MITVVKIRPFRYGNLYCKVVERVLCSHEDIVKIRPFRYGNENLPT